MSFSAIYKVDGRTYTVGGDTYSEAGRRATLAIPKGIEGKSTPTEKVKVSFATTMQVLIIERNTTPKPGEDATPAEIAAYQDRMRCIATALTDLEKAKMMAVNALHTRSNAGVAE